MRRVPMILIGTGSHAQRLVDLFDLGPDGYCANENCAWLDAERYSDNDALELPPSLFILGIGGVHPTQLQKRLAVARKFTDRGWTASDLVHATAFVGDGVSWGDGVHVMNGAQISTRVGLGEHVLVNAGAVVEHHVTIGAGTHIAPHATILGNVTIGQCCMIGAGAVVLQGTSVPDHTMVKALSLWSGP